MFLNWFQQWIEMRCAFCFVLFCFFFFILLFFKSSVKRTFLWVRISVTKALWSEGPCLRRSRLLGMRLTQSAKVGQSSLDLTQRACGAQALWSQTPIQAEISRFANLCAPKVESKWEESTPEGHILLFPTFCGTTVPTPSEASCLTYSLSNDPWAILPDGCLALQGLWRRFQNNRIALLVW